MRKSRGKKVLKAEGATSPKGANVVDRLLPAGSPTSESVVAPERKVFRPVAILGEALADMIIRERG